MEKRKITFEHELHARSAKVIWPLISTARGLQRWIADEVTRNDDKLKFGWGTSWRHHEVRTATVTKEVSPVLFEWIWDDEGYTVEMKLEQSEVTGDYILIVTDFSDDDEEWLEALWQSNFERLHNATGL